MKKIIIIGLLLITTGTIAPKLIEIGPLPENTTVDEETGLKAADGKFYLETDVEDYIFADTYNNFIAAQQAKDLPYIIAITTTKIADDKFLYSASGAHGLNKFLFEGGDPARPYFWNRYNAQDLQQKTFTDFKRRSLINRISYYLINTPEDAVATMLGTDYDLLEDPNKKEFMQNFFKANLNDADAQFELADLFDDAHDYRTILIEGKNNSEESERYFKLAADQNHADAQYMLGNLYVTKGDLQLAKKYFTLSADQNHSQAQTELGILFEEGEDDLDEAERYYTLAAEQKNPEAQFKLGNLLYKKGNFERAKDYYKLAARNDIADTYIDNAYYGLGNIAEKSFDLGTAKKHFQSAANKGNGAAPEAITRIDAKIARLQEQESAEPSTSSKKRQRED